MKKRQSFLILLLAVFLSSCASNISPKTYSVGSVGQVNRTISATVISVRDVDISGTSRLGGGVGAAAGGIAGSNMGSSGNDALLGALAGAVVGGLAGAAIEENGTQQKGLEYVVETENGNLMTIVQGSNTIFREGQKVLVLYGSPSRIIADPRVKQ